MVRVLFEVSLPARALSRVRSALAPGTLPQGVGGRLEEVGGLSGCESPARGGDAAWTPCWISLEGEPGPGFTAALRRLRREVVAAAAEGGLEVLAIPATAEVDGAFHRYRDVLDAVDPSL